MKKTFAFWASVVLLATVVRAAAPFVSFDGDTVTVVVPTGNVIDNASLILCWGASDGGETPEGWEHAKLVSDNGVTAAGGTWSVSASEAGIATGDAMRAFVSGPKKFRVVEYIESTTGVPGTGGKSDAKTVAIYSGVDAKTGLHVKTKMRWNGLQDCEFCGGRSASGQPTRIFPVHIYQDKWFLGYGDSTANTVAVANNTDYEVETKLYAGLQTMSVGGTQIYEMHDSSGNIATGGPCAIFAAYYPANAPYYTTCYSKARCYYLKMWENGNTTDNLEGDLVRDFIPVKDEFGHGALYDQVTSNLFESVFQGPGPTEYLSAVGETGEIVAANNKSNFVLSAALAYDPTGAGGARPTGFAFSLVPTLANGQFSLAAGFSCTGVGSCSLDDFAATLTVGETTIDGTIDWVAGTIAFPSVAVSSDADAVFALAYGEGADERFVSRLPVCLETSGWFASSAASLEADGVWTGATVRDGRIALSSDASYTPHSKARADLRVIDFASVFGVMSGTGSAAPAGAKFGIEIRETNDGPRFFVIANGAWQQVSSAAADPFVEYRVQICLDGAAKTVAYYVTGADGLTALFGPYANPASAEAVSRIAFSGASQLDSVVGVRRGLPADYAFNAVRKKGEVTVVVDRDAVTNDNMALVLCYDRKDRGDEASDWGNYLVLDETVGATGGVYSVDLAAYGIDGGRVRPFLVRLLGNIKLYESLSSQKANDNNFGFVDTTVPAKHGTRVVTKMSWQNTTSASDWGYFAARRKGGEDSRLMLIHCYPGKWGQGYKTGNWNDQKTSAIVNNQIYEVEAKGYAGLQELKVDGVVKCSGTVADALDYSTIDFSLFAIKYVDRTGISSSDGAHACAGSATCYYLKVYVNGDKDTNPNGDLARDFVPASRDGRCGLYDLKNREFVPGSENYLTCNNKTNELPCTIIRDTLNHDPGAMPVRDGMMLIVR